MGPPVEGPAGKRRGRHQEFTHRVPGQLLELTTGLDDEDVPVLARQVEFSIGRHRRGAEAAAAVAKTLAVDLLAGGELVAIEQAVVVQDGLVLGVEAVEGTDALLSRCAGLRREGPGGVLVKLGKPGQETRADLPTIVVDTIRGAKNAGLRGVAVEAGITLILSRAQVIAEADEAGLFLVGLSAP